MEKQDYIELGFKAGQIGKGPAMTHYSDMLHWAEAVLDKMYELSAIPTGMHLTQGQSKQ